MLYYRNCVLFYVEIFYFFSGLKLFVIKQHQNEIINMDNKRRCKKVYVIRLNIAVIMIRKKQ